ncbi:MAG: hypothetical protein IPN08_00250 [Bacteroidales bacterium]|nr:hypothetical protein [Bacteroidales bacterium]
MKRFALLLAISGFYFLANAQEGASDPKLQKFMANAMTIDKFLALPDAEFWQYSKAVMYERQGFDDGHGMWVWPPALKTFPKRVGLLSFMVFDPGFFEVSSKRYGGPDIGYRVTTSKGASLKLESTMALADFFYNETLPELRENFRYFGSELLTPEEFITSDAIREAYNNFSYEEKGIGKWMSKEGSYQTIACPSGQRLFYAESFSTPSFLDAIGPKAKELGLDAVIILKIQMGIDEKGTISIQSMNYGMYGPNPVPKDPGKKYVAINPATGYHDCVVYSAKKLGAFDLDALLETKEGMNVVVSAESKTAKITKMEGVGKLINKLALGANYELDMWIKGTWKPFKYK